MKNYHAIMGFLFLTMLVLFNAYTLMGLYFFSLAYVIITKRYWKEFLTASSFALILFLLAMPRQNPFMFLMIKGLDIGFFFSWASGLFLAHVFARKSRLTFLYAYFVLFAFIGCFSYTGFPLCACSSEPVWLKLSYLYMGLLYLPFVRLP